MFDEFSDAGERKALQRERSARLNSTPMQRFQFVDVTFPASGSDTDVVHTLAPLVPEDVCYVVVKISAGAAVYNDQSATRTAWTSNRILLRCTSACTVKLLLFIP